MAGFQALIRGRFWALNDTEIEQRGLQGSVRFLGRLDRTQMWEAYGRCHVVIAPTSSNFAEGLNKVAVEGVLAGRPVVATDVCHAGEVLGLAIVEVAAGDVDGMVHAILNLATDREFYERKRAACREVSQPFYDPDQSWGAALRTAIDAALRGREHEDVRKPD